ncbi:MAG: tRNA 2-selenouridine(34) synthase MnmH [Bacteroidetes bacterium]|nr:tRNA 2-selenouridine(34) synthase MnmH [Bacteroidota bacterium]
MIPAPSLPIEEFLREAQSKPIFDVRTPSEFAHAHIPTAKNLALFSDEERAIIGTAYKLESREKAIMHGFEFFGPKMKLLVETALEQTDSKNVLVHCWRGGMRSSAIAWLLNFYGITTHTLVGGYKSFRNYALQSFGTLQPMIIIGGKTGSRKTLILNELKKLNQQTIDLEGIALHKGSAFGALGMPAQPSQEQFENSLAVEYRALDRHQNLWLEDESRKIGMAMIPENLFKQLRSAPVVVLEVPIEQRVTALVEDYGTANQEELRSSILKIRERLGGLQTKMALEELDRERMAECFEILLNYYDKSYQFGLDKRDPETLHSLHITSSDSAENARLVLDFAQSITM